MIQADYTNARGSNAGDDFHELWVLRQALSLLNKDSELTAITVEGLRAEDESGTPEDTWEGVDCTFYYGGEDAQSANRIVLDQVKYSGAHPEQVWTVARLTYSKNKKKANSVIGKLANAFQILGEKRPDLVKQEKLNVRLTSNMNVDAEVIKALSGSPDHENRKIIQRASNLDDSEFEHFAKALNFSEYGQESRFALEERILRTISEWTDDDARTQINELMRFVRKKMMPEAAGEYISRYSILALLGFSDPRALFPCSSEIRKIERLIPRRVSRQIIAKLLDGEQRICLHGIGGCGKTTILQEIETMLPGGSLTIIFDCYGGGRYLDSDAYRHRPKDAFLQMSNELAGHLQIPLLINRTEHLDYPRVFRNRLERAATVVASIDSNALLVIVVDAADNSIFAANTQSPMERSFVHDFVTLGGLPNNVRLIVTARSGRLPSLNLPDTFTRIEIAGFTPEETAENIHTFWSDAPDFWLEDFQHLSQGNPRVQKYALEYAGADPSRAINYLRPKGKDLDQIFKLQLDYAHSKVGTKQDIRVFCSGLIALPRPIPVTTLSAVTGLSQEQIRDLSADLAPGVRLKEEAIRFADEDFEEFIRREGTEKLGEIQEQIADHFIRQHQGDAYAATHLAASLFNVHRRKEILGLIQNEQAPTAIGDPVLRREVQLKRLQIAMKVCRETGNNVEALMTILIGAEALKTDEAIHKMLKENPDLAANFANETSSRMILGDPNEIEHHGPLLFHLMVVDACSANSIAVREGYRQLQAWLQRRKDLHEEERKKHPDWPDYPFHGWEISDADIAAETEASLRMNGPEQAVHYLQRWSPKPVALHVAAILTTRLITQGESYLIKQCLTDNAVNAPWDLLLLTPLAIAGEQVDLSKIITSLQQLLRRGLIRLDKLQDIGRYSDRDADYFDTIITACEIIIARHGNYQKVVPILEQIANKKNRQTDSLYTSQASKIDFSLRAHTLLENLSGRKTKLETFLIEPPDLPGNTSEEEAKRQKRSTAERKKELEAFISPLLDIYNLRAQAVTDSNLSTDFDRQFREAIIRYRDDYQVRRTHFVSGMRTRIALSITRLLAIENANRPFLLDYVNELVGSNSKLFINREESVFSSLALDRSLHPQILKIITQQATTVKEMKVSADDKISSLVILSRLLLPISKNDSETLFNKAIEVAGETNYDAIHEIALLAPLSSRAVESMDFDHRRKVACDLAVVVSDTSVRLEGNDHFPWATAVQGLAILDVSLALVAVSRWEDEGIKNRFFLLPPVLKTALSRQQMTPAQVSALSSLLNDFDEAFLQDIIELAGKHEKGYDLTTLKEFLARVELLHFGMGKRQQVYERLSSLPTGDFAGFWFECLEQASKFHQDYESQHPADESQEPSSNKGKKENEKSNPLDNLNWTENRFIAVDEINNMLMCAQKGNQETDFYYTSKEILERIGKTVALADRLSHLKALSRIDRIQAPDYEVVQAISNRIEEWNESPSVTTWCRGNLLQLVIDYLPSFSRWLPYDEAPLLTILEKSSIDRSVICTALLQGIERHVDDFDAPKVYALVGLVVNYCPSEEAAQVISRYSQRLIERIPVAARDEWNIEDLPVTTNNSIARYLYALMGDLDTRVRWCAIHAVRNLARLGEYKIIDSLIGLYDRKSDECFRAPKVPFYWLAARLWLVIALDRIASETPTAVERHGLWLLGIAQNPDFPHVLLQSFAKSAVKNLIALGKLELDLANTKKLEQANTSPVKRKKTDSSFYLKGFEKYSYEQRKDRRFHFNSMDTLPHWYTGALRIFTDVSDEEFLDIAERWIVDEWGETRNPWKWDDEPRRHRITDRGSILTGHSHGSMPILERYNTYLEWHAMFCTVGELMQNHALRKASREDYESFEYWLEHECLSFPPLWLADLQAPRPLEPHLWFPPQMEVDTWIDKIQEEDFLGELAMNHETIVVGSDHDTRSRDFHASVRLNTALVAPQTAGSLMRALQSVRDSWDYTIPTAGGNAEIFDPPYSLKGWLVHSDSKHGIDERDALRFGVDAIQLAPSNKTIKVLNLTYTFENMPKWVDAKNGAAVFIYEAWGNSRHDDSEEGYYYGKDVRADGWRLQIDKSSLRKFLSASGFDLIVQIELTRRNKGDDYSGYDTKKEKESRFDRVLILRADGNIESTEGCLGTWTTPRS